MDNLVTFLLCIGIIMLVLDNFIFKEKNMKIFKWFLIVYFFVVTILAAYNFIYNFLY